MVTAFIFHRDIAFGSPNRRSVGRAVDQTGAYGLIPVRSIFASRCRLPRIVNQTRAVKARAESKPQAAAQRRAAP